MFVETSKKLNYSDINEVEAKLNIVLPKQLVRHYMKYNGGIPEKSFFYSYISDIETSVHTFLPIKYEDEVGYTLEDMYVHFTSKNIFPKKYLLFACDAGGNLYCINMENEKIVIIWLDVGEVNEDMIPVLSNSFDEFLNCLEVDEDE